MIRQIQERVRTNHFLGDSLGKSLNTEDNNDLCDSDE